MLTDDDIMAQVLAAFIEEQAEHRQAAGELLLTLERTPEHPQRQSLLDQLFREAHSLKGGARAAGQAEVEQLAHHVEDLFSAVRQGRCQLTPDVCDPIYAALDAIGALMDLVVADQPADLGPYQPLLIRLSAILAEPTPGARSADGVSPPSVAARAGEPASDRPPAAAESASLGEDKSADSGGAPSSGSYATVRLSTAALDELLNEAGELLTCAIGVQQQARAARDLADLPMRWRRIWRQTQPTVRRLQARQPTLRPTVHYLDGRDQLPAAPSAPGDHDTAVLIDALLQAQALIADLEQRLMLHAHQATEDHVRLHDVADRLHRQVRRTRMLPVSTIFSPLRLQVREMARAAGKRVAIDLDDGGAEADRQVLERLGEVVLHLLRNAVDHGIEPAEARVASGKPAEGRVTLRAAVSGDRLTLTIADDGAGLDMAAIRQGALDQQRLSSADLARMSEADMLDLIFLPGFTTRQVVGPLSGRGVGLDIVRSRIERMQGRVVVQSAPNAGCTFNISIPLSLTSTHGLLLRAGPTRYAIPLESVQQIIPVVAQDIRMLEGRAVIQVDGRPLALAQLSDLLGQPAASASERALAWHGLIIGSGERQVACLVDAVLGEQELVVQRLPAPLQRVPTIAGATILADGTVVPILDVIDLLNAALGTRRTIALAPDRRAAARRATILVVDDSITTRTLEKNILEAAGYHVRLATDGIEALQLLDSLTDDTGCDLLLSDVDMPRLNGFDLTARVRADQRFQHLPVVLVTSLDTTQDRERGVASGADAYIVKRQFEQQVLLDTIARLI